MDRAGPELLPPVPGPFDTATSGGDDDCPGPPDLSQIIQELLTILEQLGLSDEDKNDVQAEAETVQAQLKKSSPKPSIISGCVQGIKDALAKYGPQTAGIAGGALLKGLLDKLSSWLAG